jgi:hypothetical protein
MEFIEMTGKTLLRLSLDGGPDPDELVGIGVNDESVCRINRQGDIEIRRPEGWDLVGGLLGDYEHRIKTETGLDWL